MSTTSFSRKACLSDFINDDKSTQPKNNNYQSQNDTIAKNQQEFGHKKRIKP